MNNNQIIGIAWFKQDDWEEWKKISQDKLEDKYDDWLIEASLAKLDLEKDGHSIKQVTITPNNFKAWCKNNNKQLNSASRSEYVSELLQKAHS